MRISLPEHRGVVVTVNTSSPQSVPKRYARPPITERAIRVYADIPEDVFQEKLGEWADVVRNEFPFYSRKVEWNLVLSGQGDLPNIDLGKSAMSLCHRYWSCDPSAKHADWCMQLFRDSFILNMRRRPGQPQDQRGFTELLERFNAWVTRWTGVFCAPEISRVRLQYWNTLNQYTLPGLASNNEISVGEVMAVFAQTPVPRNVEKYIAPYQCMQSWRAIVAGSEYSLRAETKSLDGTPTALQVRFWAEALLTDTLGLQEALGVEHQLISDTFDAFFTAKAKAAFGVEP